MNKNVFISVTISVWFTTLAAYTQIYGDSFYNGHEFLL